MLTSEQLLKKICQGKQKAKDRCYKYNITPDVDDENWCDAIFEARDRGIPIASFGDTRDKTVLHAGHFGYNFDYFWGRGTWGDSCWTYSVKKTKKYESDTSEEDCFDVDDETIIKGTNELVAVGKHLLTLGLQVWIVNVSGSGKGHLSTIPNYLTADFEYKYEHFNQDYVLFVFNFNPEDYC